MIIKGASTIRGIRALNIRSGLRSESKTLLELYQLATEKEHLLKKLQWILLQKEQAEKQLSEITRTAQTVEKRIIRETTSHANFHSRFIEY